MGKAELRQQETLKLLESTPVMLIAHLAEHFHITSETMRKDLTILENEGRVIRTRGSVALVEPKEHAMPYKLREDVHKEEKALIGKTAISLIEEGDIVLFESSTTTLFLCQELLLTPELLKTITVITNSFFIAQIFEMGHLCRKLLFLGGWLTPTESAAKGSLTTAFLSQFRVDKTFISGAALDSTLTLLADHENNLRFQQTAIECADTSILLLDKHKYPVRGLYTVSDLSNIDYLVSDINFTEPDELKLKQLKVKILHAE